MEDSTTEVDHLVLLPSDLRVQEAVELAMAIAYALAIEIALEAAVDIAIEIAKRAGGDRGCRALKGPDDTPPATKPARLMVLETAGWNFTDDASKAAFNELRAQMAAAGIEMIDRHSNASVNFMEHAIVDAQEIAGEITQWENRWAIRNMIDQYGDKVSFRSQGAVKRAEAMSVGDYEILLTRREAAQAAHANLAGLADVAITLSCPGPAPLWDASAPDADKVKHPTGYAIFNYPSSMLFAPVVTVPLMAIDGLPVGLQVMGWPGDDAKVTAIARWIQENIAPVVG